MSINTAKPLLAASFLFAVETTVKMAKQLFIFPVQSVFFPEQTRVRARLTRVRNFTMKLRARIEKKKKDRGGENK